MRAVSSSSFRALSSAVGPKGWDGRYDRTAFASLQGKDFLDMIVRFSSLSLSFHCHFFNPDSAYVLRIIAPLN